MMWCGEMEFQGNLGGETSLSMSLFIYDSKKYIVEKQGAIPRTGVTSIFCKEPDGKYFRDSRSHIVIYVSFPPSPSTP